MGTSKGYRVLVSAVAFLGAVALSGPGISRGFQLPQMPSQSSLSTQSDGNTLLQWPSNQINISQIEQILGQNPGLSQLNIQFPNQLNWSVTPDSLQKIIGSIQQGAQSNGVMGGSMPNLSFSSLNSGAGNQISIPDLMKGNISSQVDSIMRSVRYQELNLSSYLPDWLKEVIVSVYDATYSAVNYMQAQVDSLVHSILG